VDDDEEDEEEEDDEDDEEKEDEPVWFWGCNPFMPYKFGVLSWYNYYVGACQLFSYVPCPIMLVCASFLAMCPVLLCWCLLS
jgi:hypothetical protein